MEIAVNSAETLAIFSEKDKVDFVASFILLLKFIIQLFFKTVFIIICKL
nr:MAG TPA: hypothetical protein [Caudoviricetes sp.]